MENDENIDMKFKKSCKDITESKISISDNDKLELYGLFKHSTIGDNNTPEPWKIQYEKYYKWNAWNNHKGQSKIETKKKYIQKVEMILS